MMQNYFQGTIEHPQHISIGAVVRNDEGKICVHYFERIAHPSIGEVTDLYLLMRETIEPHESIEACLHRGLLEEFGMKATLVEFLGPIVSHFPKDSIRIEKTTLYFLCDFVSSHESDRKAGDIEATSHIEWHFPSELIPKMKAQGVRLHREDMDESFILERVLMGKRG